MSLQVLAASASAYRRCWYIEQLPRYEIDVTAVANGVECIAVMKARKPDVLLLEPSLLWGGSIGILAVRSEEADLKDIPVVLIAVDGVSPEWYQLAQYPVQGLILRRQSGQKLAATLLAAVEHSCRTSLVQ